MKEAIITYIRWASVKDGYWSHEKIEPFDIMWSLMILPFGLVYLPLYLIAKWLNG